MPVRNADNVQILFKPWKRLNGSELDGSEHFEKNCQNVPGDAGAAVGAAAAAAVAAFHHVLICGREAPLVIT